MSKLNQEELLEILRDIKLFIKSERTGWWDEKDEQTYQQIKEMIQKPQVTEEWIEKKAKELLLHVLDGQFYNEEKRKDFIRSLIEEVK